MNHPAVSIIIPTFNTAAIIATALNSIQQQTFARFEVLVMDGLSEDGTAAIVKKYAQSDSRIKFFSQKDDGIYEAMNKGIQQAKGEWLYFMGSDDSLYNEHVLHCIQEIIKKRKKR